MGILAPNREKAAAASRSKIALWVLDEQHRYRPRVCPLNARENIAETP
jgi:hypothetical protein